jgi:hypothetical protein
MAKLGYLGIDQYGTHYVLKEHPRKELMEQIGCKHVDKMFVDLKSGGSREKGYVIAGHWIDIYEVHPWKEEPDA